MSTRALRLASPHEHVCLGDNHERNERRTWLVIVITAVMMVVEITAGSIFGLMALIADGGHMSTHAEAMLIAALAYRYARRNARNARFTFGTGKMGDLAGFASAVVLALIALLIGWERRHLKAARTGCDMMPPIEGADDRLWPLPGHHGLTPRNRDAFAITLTNDSAIDGRPR